MLLLFCNYCFHGLKYSFEDGTFNDAGVNLSVEDKIRFLQNADIHSRTIPSISCQNILVHGGGKGSSWKICLDELDRRQFTDCLVYSVGIADDWSFDKKMGELGCEVHSFDPTQNYTRKLAPNVTFHKIGLYGGILNDSRTINFTNKIGWKMQTDAKMLHFGEVVDVLGHSGRRISIFN